MHEAGIFKVPIRTFGARIEAPWSNYRRTRKAVFCIIDA